MVTATVVTSTAMPMVVDATPVAPVPVQTPMMVTIPAGVAAGGQFMVQTPDGSSMIVQCPPQNKEGDTVQIMVPSSASAMPVATACGGAPTGGMGATAMSHPAPGFFPASVVCTPPLPIRKSSMGSKTANPDRYDGSFGTESPHATRRFLAHQLEGVCCEADFDRSTIVGGTVDAVDPFGGFLSASQPKMKLDVDVAGRVAELKAQMDKNCKCYAACCLLVPVGGFCAIFCRHLGQGPALMGGCGPLVEEAPLKEEERASAHSITLYDDHVVYERKAYTTKAVRACTACPCPHARRRRRLRPNNSLLSALCSLLSALCSLPVDP
jgi:hypothetical protein